MNSGKNGGHWHVREVLICLALFAGGVFVAWYSLPLSVPKRLTTTTSIYATMITILLALLALAITAFVFLSTALKERRQPFEQETIHAMLSRRTCQLLGLTVGGLFCLAACVFLDNTVSAFFQLPCFIIFASAACFAEGILLIWYIWFIVKYESSLKEFANESREKLYIQERRLSSAHAGKLKRFARKVCKKLRGLEKSSMSFQEGASVFKLVGDLELLVNQLLHNHKDNFHQADSVDVLKTITSQNFAEKYTRLISYRNYLRVEELDAADAEEWESVRADIRELENDLREKYLKGERLKDLGFVSPFLEQGDKPFSLQTTIFTGSAFEQVNLSGADLTGADFSHTRLNGILLLDKAVCEETIFSGSVWREVKVDANCNFEKAVFRGADLGRQSFSAGPGQMFHFQNASFNDANLLECVFQRADLRFANFQNALLIRAKMRMVCLSYASFRGATLTGMELEFDQTESYPFPLKDYWQPSQLDPAGNPLPSYEIHWREHRLGPAFFMNLEHAVLAQACFSDCNFTGSRFAGANLSDTLFKHCIFDRCFSHQATFQEATIDNCRFGHAILNKADFSHAQIQNCDFRNAGLRGCLMIQTKIVTDEVKAWSNFQQVNFTGAQLRGCEFTRCDFTNALFVDADLTGTHFVQCIFTGAKFDGAYMDSVEYSSDCIDIPRPDRPAAATGGEARGAGNDAGPGMKMTVEEAVSTRQSTRAFRTDRDVDDETLNCVLRAALQAPSPKNRQPWHFTVIRDRDIRDKLAGILEKKLGELREERLNRGGGINDLTMARGSVCVMRDAPVLIFVSYIRDEGNEHGDPHSWPLSAQPFETGDLQSIGAAVENLLLAAVSEGVDSLWIGDVLYAYQELMDALKLPDPFIAAVALGYRARRAAPRKSLEEKVTIWEKTFTRLP